MDVVDLLGVYNHDKDHSDLARSLNHLEMETLQMQHKNIVLHPPVPESTVDVQWETMDNVSGINTVNVESSVDVISQFKSIYSNIIVNTYNLW